MRFQFIKKNASVFPTDLLCTVLRVSRSSYYAWQRRPESKRAAANRKLLCYIKEAYKQGQRGYGYPRVCRELRRQGMPCSYKRVARLMRENGIRAKQSRKFKATTNSKHNLPVAPNLLKRNFLATAPNQKWVTDITYIPTREGWLYLAVMIDLYSRRVVGWSMDRRMTVDLVIDALQMALASRNVDAGLIHHSDRGSQYASAAYQAQLKRAGILCSMSGKGDCWDNAVAESFFHTLKVERVNHEDYQTREQAKASIFDFIEIFYNRKRLHSTLNYATPVEFEMKKVS